MAIFNSFTFDNENSLDYGVYITGEAVYNAPERAVEMVSIPGKNGALALDQGRFENIEVTYPAGAFGAEQAEFADRMRAMRNMLASRYNYVRLTDSYHPDEYRLGLYKNGLEVTPVAMSSAGEFDITFNCKPQRFLTSGEEPVDTSELGGEVTTDTEPYLFRRSGGGTIGHDFDAEIDKIIGGTVAWNQLVPNSGSVSVTVPSGHKYFSNIGGTKAIAISNGSAISATGGTDNIVDLTALFGSAEIADYVYSLEQTTEGSGIAWLKSYGFLAKDYYAYDSGSLVSVKTSEHRTVGKNLCPKIPSYTQTSSGATFTSQADGSVKVTGTASKNDIWYRPSEGVFMLPAGSYRVSGGGNANNYVIRIGTGSSNTYLEQVGTGYRSFTLTELTEIHVALRIQGLSGQSLYATYHPMIYRADAGDDYEPYESHSYPLGNDDLRGIFKLSNGNLYADGDVKTSDGKIARKYGIVDLGTIDWRYDSANSAFASVAPFTPIKLGEANTKINGVCSAYEVYKYGWYGSYAGMNNILWVHPEGHIIIRDTSKGSSASDFKTAMSGVYLVYELATPTTETADPYDSPQIVSPLGTEEYVDTRNVPVPVGHETRYGMSQLVLSNPTEFPSKPLMEVTGVGTFWLGDTLFTITGTAGQTIYIDCETGEAWKNNGGIMTPANGLVTLNRLDFPELDPGDTPVMYGTGITKVVVTPRWWRI